MNIKNLSKSKKQASVLRSFVYLEGESIEVSILSHVELDDTRDWVEVFLCNVWNEVFKELHPRNPSFGKQEDVALCFGTVLELLREWYPQEIASYEKDKAMLTGSEPKPNLPLRSPEKSKEWSDKAIKSYDFNNKNFLDLNRAFSYLNYSIRLNPLNDDAHSYRGIAYCQSGDYQKSIDDHTKAISINNKKINHFIFRADAFLKSGMPKESIEDANQVIMLEPENSMGYVERYNLNFALKKYDLALEDMIKAVQMDPGAMSYYCLGYHYGYTKNHQKAVENYSESIKFDPNNAKVYVYRGHAYRELGEFENMCSDFRTACRLGDCQMLELAIQDGYCQ